MKENKLYEHIIDKFIDICEENGELFTDVLNYFKNRIKNQKTYDTKIVNEIRDLLPLGNEFSDEQIIASAEVDYDNLVELRNNLQYNDIYTPYEEDIQTIDHNLDYLEIFIKLLKGKE